ncbi:MAG: hypothetical protein NXI31_25045 [bacterium]|nr:hypothetical protein [bacterium]
MTRFSSAAAMAAVLAASSLTGLVAQGQQAMVNDPASHGQVGDARLSLDEAIQLANGTLSQSALSALEQAQITGSGPAVTRIMVNPMMIPTITLSAPLTDIVGSGNGEVMIMGMPMGAMQKTVIQAGSETHAFAVRDHEVMLMGFRIVGGQVAVDAAMPALAGPMIMARVMQCELDGQTTAGIKLHCTGGEESMLMVMRSQLTNMPVGIMIDEQTSGGRFMSTFEWVTLDNVDVGCDLMENGSGNLSMFMMFRSTFQNGVTLAKKRRGSASSQSFMFRFTHMRATCTGDVVDIEGGANGLTMVHHHTSDWIAGAGKKAFWVRPRTALFDIHGSEMVFDGDVDVAGNPFTQRVWQQNNDYKNGIVRYDVEGALPNLLWNRYTNCTFIVPPTATSPVTVRQSEFVNTNIDGQSAFASVTLDGSYRSGGTLTGNVNENNVAPGIMLGDTTISPLDPQIGSTINLSSDLPPGVGLFWIFALSYSRPTTTIEPVRFYGNPLSAVVLPGMSIYQSTTSVPLPNTPALADVEMYVQGATIPLFGQTWMPEYHLPRGEVVQARL